MTTKRIAFQRPDGTIGVVIPAPGYIAKLREQGMTVAQIIDHIKSKDVPADAVASRVIDVTDLPQSRRFRNAWRSLSGVITPDLTEARAQLVAELRAERNVRLTTSDAHIMRRRELGLDETQWRLYRQQLRDLPAVVKPELDAITTAEGLEDYVPPWPTEPAI